MKSYAAIKAEIAKLERQAETARKTEIAGVVSRIKEAIAAYGLTAQDLGLGGAARGARAAAGRSASAGASTIGVPKYRDPETGRTWTGRGKPPGWIAGVKDRTPFLIDASADSGEGGRRGGPKAARKGRVGAKGTNGAKRAGGRRAGSGRKSAAAPDKTAAVNPETGAAE